MNSQSFLYKTCVLNNLRRESINVHIKIMKQFNKKKVFFIFYSVYKKKWLFTFLMSDSRCLSAPFSERQAKNNFTNDKNIL